MVECTGASQIQNAVSKMAFTRLYVLLLISSVCMAKVLSTNKLMLILMDGFRYDYFTPELGGFNRMFENGVKADYMIPAFPSVSMTNYYSILTGLYAENHGFIGNKMYDAPHDMYYTLKTGGNDSLPFWWNGGVPLWTEATRQNKKTYVYMWMGCEVNITGVKPAFCEPYPNRATTLQDLDRHISLSLTAFQEEDLDLSIIYMEQTDKIGHRYGPESQEIKDVVKELDRRVGTIQDELKKRHLADKVNVIILSDHGMATKWPRKKMIYIQEYIKREDLERHILTGPVAYIWPKPSKLMAVYNSLKTAHPNMTAYLKKDIPAYWGIKKHPRMSPLLLLIDQGWSMTNKPKPLPLNKTRPIGGGHGYLQTLPSMRAIFLAMGPDFKRNYRQEWLSVVDVYQVACRVLGITPRPNNGTWSRVSQMMKVDVSSSANTNAVFTYALTITMILSVGGLLRIA